MVKQSLTNGDSLFNYFKKNEPFFHKAKKELLDESENKKVIYFTFRTLHFIDWFAPIDLALNKYFPNKYNIFYIDFATTLHRIGNGFEYLYFCQQVQQRLISFEISPLNHFSYYNEIKEEYDAMKAAGKESHRHEKFMLNFPDAEAYVKANTGLRVPSLAKKPEGLGSVTGIAVGPESFRGKVLRFIPWLDEDLVGESYNDHEADELLEYGERLLEAAEDKEKELGEAKTEEEEEQVTTLKEAAQWCIFWGREGHAMHAWY